MTPTRLVATASVAGTLLFLAACGGGGGDSEPAPVRPEMPETPRPSLPEEHPDYHLRTLRFTTHQPQVLERIGAHHAYAQGLTGKGVRIGIEDTIVDYTQYAEFGSRVRLTDTDGARLAYARPDGGQFLSDVDTCVLFNPSCSIWEGDSDGDSEAVNRWVRRIVSTDGWPVEDDSVFIQDDHFSDFDPIGQLLRWSEVPTPYGPQGSHGTIVASAAAGTNLGVAPEATIIPIAKNLSDDQGAEALAELAIRLVIEILPADARQQLDGALARAVRDDLAKFDVINRSYGISLFDPDVVSSEIHTELQWYRRYMPQTLDAEWQTNTPDARKTVLVYAAGNDGQRWSGLGADLPYYIPQLRGHSLAVAATDPTTGAIAPYSNRCGPLPPDWNGAQHGPHYCLAAPGTVRGLVPNPDNPGSGDVRDGLSGTSFAAPIVSGSLALLMEHFRGTRGNTEIVKRMLDTADRSGRYADLETYGAGHLDLEAALSPVGALNAGQSAHALNRTALQTPAAFGAVAQRAGDIELAAFDEQDFPFWVPMSALSYARTSGRSPIPSLVETGRATAPGTGLDALGLHWMAVPDVWNSARPRGHQSVAGFGPNSAGFARRPRGAGWGYGLSFDERRYMGAATSGAFGSDLRSGMVWTSRTWEHPLGSGLTVGARGTLALGMPQYEDDAIFRASSSVLSAMSVRVGAKNTGLTLEQPLRAETGVGTFQVENGRIESGPQAVRRISRTASPRFARDPGVAPTRSRNAWWEHRHRGRRCGECRPCPGRSRYEHGFRVPHVLVKP